MRCKFASGKQQIRRRKPDGIFNFAMLQLAQYSCVARHGGQTGGVLRVMAAERAARSASWPAQAGHPRLHLVALVNGVDRGPSPAMTVTNRRRVTSRLLSKPDAALFSSWPGSIYGLNEVEIVQSILVVDRDRVRRRRLPIG
jgi:hypothetical protein